MSALETLASKCGMTRDEVLAIAREELPRDGSGPQIAKNKNGGLFFRDTRIKAWSENKSKHYVPSVNLQWEVAKALFGNTLESAERLKTIRQFVQSQMR